MNNKKNSKFINFKNNNGFTMYDLIIAFAIIILVAGVIGTTYSAIYTIQTETKLDTIATLFAVQITEYIDKIPYEEVNNDIDTETIKTTFNIPEAFLVSIDVSNYKKDENNIDIIKMVKIQIDYNFRKDDKKIVFNRLKVKEL